MDTPKVAEFFGFVIEHPTKLLPASKQQFPLSQASPCMHQINLAYIIMCVSNNVRMCCTKYSWQSHDYIYGHYVLFAIGCINSNSGPYTYCTQPTCKIQLQMFGSLATTAHYNDRHVGRGKFNEDQYILPGKYIIYIGMGTQNAHFSSYIYTCTVYNVQMHWMHIHCSRKFDYIDNF